MHSPTSPREADQINAVTTRAVCRAAGITAPTLYHYFGDKDGLLRALVAQNIETFMERKRSRPTADALADLRRGWYGWIDFAGENPKLFRLMIESTRSDPSATASQEVSSSCGRLSNACRTRVA
jgi:AcrR family transcriptional regulator